MPDGGMTEQTLALIKGATQLGDAVLGTLNNGILAKSVTAAGTGLVGYDLQAPAKNLYPVLTPLRNIIPRVGGDTGLATNWRVVSAITGSGVSSMPWVPEGQRSGRMSYTTANKAATYVTLGEEDQVTFESVSASRGFEDIRATASMRLLQMMMIKEENAILGGNTSVSLGTPVAPTVSTATTGGTIAAATYNVIVVALTYEGYMAASVTNGVVQSQNITGADGLSYVLNGGSSNKSAATSQVTTGATSTISASTPVVNGAVAYAWYVGTAGNELLQAITTINSVKLTAVVASARQNASAITADRSANTTVPAFDGLLYAAFNSGNGAYVSSLATGTAGTGTPLTASGRGTVNEIDAMCLQLWNQYKVSPTRLLVSAQELKNITAKILTNATGPLLHYYATADDQGRNGYQLTAGGQARYYFNPFTANGGAFIPITLHPTLPPGTILAHCENLPVQYQNNYVPNVAEVKTRRDYYEIDWVIRTRQWEMGVYVEECLAVYAPFALGILTNIADG